MNVGWLQKRDIADIMYWLMATFLYLTLKSLYRANIDLYHMSDCSFFMQVFL